MRTKTATETQRATEIGRVGYSIAEVAAMTSFSKAFVRLEIQRGNLVAIKRGRRVMVPKSAFEEYIAPDVA